jgi:hypothetical protein
MKNKPIYINDLHFEHKLWIRQLEFERDELKIFGGRLEEVVSRWTDKEVLRKAEHFQNMFIRHHEVLDTLIHDINAHEQTIIEQAKDHPVAIDHVHFKDHPELRDKVETQNKLYTELKTEFLNYLRHAM